jgi:putative NADPH-quinone reductase
MLQTPKVIAIVGSYRKGGIVDSALDEILDAASEAGAVVSKVYLADKHIEFCLNCRRCTQAAGTERGVCVHQDEMASLLQEIETADAVILGSPVNCFTVTALTKRFIERMVCYAYWPWGARAPSNRRRARSLKALLVITCAMPAFFAPLFTGNRRVLKSAIALLGGRVIGSLVIGQVAQQEKEQLPSKARIKARHWGRKLVAACT